MPRRELIWVVIAWFALAGATAAVMLFWLGPIHQHRKWSERVRGNLYSLVNKRPPDVPPGQWEFMVGWTLNLHANWGTSHTFVDRGQKWPFLEELERRLQGPASVALIDWIWDEYARITRGGRGYGEKYRPTRSPDLEHAQPGCFCLWVK